MSHANGSLNPPNEIEAQGRTFRLEETELGRGSTAIVYRALEVGGEASVVVRFAYSEDDQEIFRREADIIFDWFKKFESEPDIIRYIPTLWEESYGSQTYLVLTFIGGQTLTQLLASPEPLPEAVVVRIGAQVAQMMYALHERLYATFTTLKPKNIWWLTDAGHIMVSHWYMVSDLDVAEGIPQDLSELAWLLFNLLTQGSLSESGKGVGQGFSLVELQRWGGRAWQQATPGLRAILARALHPALEERYENAELLADDLSLLSDGWDETSSVAQLTNRAARLLGALNRPQHAYWLLEILARRAPDDARVQEMLTQVRDTLDAERPSFQVAALLRDDSVDAAERHARDLAETSNDPLESQRLLYLVAAARGADAADLETLIGAERVGGVLGQLERRDFGEAATALASLAEKSEGSAHEALELLRQDARFSHQMDEGAEFLTRDEIPEARACYTEAQASLVVIQQHAYSYAALLTDAAGQPDLMLERVEQRRLARPAPVLTPDHTPEQYRAALEEYAHKPEVGEALAQAGLSHLGRGDIARADEYAALVSLVPTPSEVLLALAPTLAALRAARAALDEEPPRPDEAIARLHDAQAASQNNEALANPTRGVSATLLEEVIRSQAHLITDPLQADGGSLLDSLYREATRLELLPAYSSLRLLMERLAHQRRLSRQSLLLDSLARLERQESQVFQADKAAVLAEWRSGTLPSFEESDDLRTLRDEVQTLLERFPPDRVEEDIQVGSDVEARLVHLAKVDERAALHTVALNLMKVQLNRLAPIARDVDADDADPHALLEAVDNLLAENPVAEVRGEAEALRAPLVARVQHETLAALERELANESADLPALLAALDALLADTPAPETLAQANALRQQAIVQGQQRQLAALERELASESADLPALLAALDALLADNPAPETQAQANTLRQQAIVQGQKRQLATLERELANESADLPALLAALDALLADNPAPETLAQANALRQQAIVQGQQRQLAALERELANESADLPALLVSLDALLSNDPAPQVQAQADTLREQIQTRLTPPPIEEPEPSSDTSLPEAEPDAQEEPTPVAAEQPHEEAPIAIVAEPEAGEPALTATDQPDEEPPITIMAEPEIEEAPVAIVAEVETEEPTLVQADQPDEEAPIASVAEAETEEPTLVQADQPDEEPPIAIMAEVEIEEAPVASVAEVETEEPTLVQADQPDEEAPVVTEVEAEETALVQADQPDEEAPVVAEVETEEIPLVQADQSDEEAPVAVVAEPEIEEPTPVAADQPDEQAPVVAEVEAEETALVQADQSDEEAPVAVVAEPETEEPPLAPAAIVAEEPEPEEPAPTAADQPHEEAPVASVAEVETEEPTLVQADQPDKLATSPIVPAITFGAERDEELEADEPTAPEPVAEEARPARPPIVPAIIFGAERDEEPEADEPPTPEPVAEEARPVRPPVVPAIIFGAERDQELEADEPAQEEARPARPPVVPAIIFGAERDEEPEADEPTAPEPVAEEARPARLPVVPAIIFGAERDEELEADEPPTPEPVAEEARPARPPVVPAIIFGAGRDEEPEADEPTAPEPVQEEARPARPPVVPAIIFGAERDEEPEADEPATPEPVQEEARPARPPVVPAIIFGAERDEEPEADEPATPEPVAEEARPARPPVVPAIIFGAERDEEPESAEEPEASPPTMSEEPQTVPPIVPALSVEAGQDESTPDQVTGAQGIPPTLTEPREEQAEASKEAPAVPAAVLDEASLVASAEVIAPIQPPPTDASGLTVWQRSVQTLVAQPVIAASDVEVPFGPLVSRNIAQVPTVPERVWALPLLRQEVTQRAPTLIKTMPPDLAAWQNALYLGRLAAVVDRTLHPADVGLVGREPFVDAVVQAWRGKQEKALAELLGRTPGPMPAIPDLATQITEQLQTRRTIPFAWIAGGAAAAALLLAVGLGSVAMNGGIGNDLGNARATATETGPIVVVTDTETPTATGTAAPIVASATAEASETAAPRPSETTTATRSPTASATPTRTATPRPSPTTTQPATATRAPTRPPRTPTPGAPRSPRVTDTPLPTLVPFSPTDPQTLRTAMGAGEVTFRGPTALASFSEQLQQRLQGEGVPPERLIALNDMGLEENVADRLCAGQPAGDFLLFPQSLPNSTPASCAESIVTFRTGSLALTLVAPLRAGGGLREGLTTEEVSALVASGTVDGQSYQVVIPQPMLPLLLLYLPSGLNEGALTVVASEAEALSLLRGPEPTVALLGYSPTLARASGVRMVPIAAESGEEAVLPSPGTIESSYPLSRPLFLYVQRSAIQQKPQVLPFLSWYLNQVTFPSFPRTVPGFVSPSRTAENEMFALFDSLQP